jgi:hypothetical protein
VSDFLSHLLDRATGNAPVLEYRRASLFEPVTKTMPFDELQPQLELVDSQTELAGRNKPASAVPKNELSVRAKPVEDGKATTASLTLREEKAPATESVVFSDAKSKREPNEEQLSTIVDRAKPSPREADTPSSRETTKTLVKEVAVPQRKVETRLDREIIVVPGPENRDAQTIKPARQPEVIQPSVQLIQPKTSLPKTDIAVLKEEIHEKSASLTRPATLSAMKPVEFPRPVSLPLQKPARRSANVQAPLPPPTPTVQVTIGRVEVRATPAPAVKQHRPTQVTPSLTLEDYLRSRSGGRA